MKPKISVIMSVYNGERFLEQSIKSILIQSYEEIEIIIIDDASTDNSLSIIESFKDERIKIIKNILKKGLTKSLNIGIKQAEGEYIARMDADDISYPDRFNEQIRWMQLHPEISVLGTWAIIIDEMGERLGEIRHETDALCIPWVLTWSNSVVHSSAMIRKKNILQVDGYNEEFAVAQDYDLWTRVVMSGGLISNMPEYLIKYRSSRRQISAINSKKQLALSIKCIKNYVSWLLERDISIDKVVGATNMFRQMPLQTELSYRESLALAQEIITEFSNRYSKDLFKNAADVLIYNAAKSLVYSDDLRVVKLLYCLTRIQPFWIFNRYYLNSLGKSMIKRLQVVIMICCTLCLSSSS